LRFCQLDPGALGVRESAVLRKTNQPEHEQGLVIGRAGIGAGALATSISRDVLLLTRV